MPHKQLDLLEGRTYRTRNGASVSLISLDDRNGTNYQILGMVHGEEYTRVWLRSGAYLTPNYAHDLDLMPDQSI